MADELWGTLLRFHREIALPDIDRVVAPLREDLAAFKRETHANFDAVWKRFDRLESEYHSLSAAMTRVETRLTGVEGRLALVQEKIGPESEN
jgi:DnaJ-domain-containing protein 1